MREWWWRFRYAVIFWQRFRFQCSPRFAWQSAWCFEINDWMDYTPGEAVDEELSNWTE